MRVTVRLSGPLRQHAGGLTALDIEVGDAATLADLLDQIERLHPAVGRRIRDEQRVLRRHVNVFIGAEECRTRGGVDAALDDGAEVSVLAAVSGGAT
jgi:molybdopterin synthase sulfur carrier subunit